MLKTRLPIHPRGFHSLPAPLSAPTKVGALVVGAAIGVGFGVLLAVAHARA